MSTVLKLQTGLSVLIFKGRGRLFHDTTAVTLTAVFWLFC